MFLRLQVHGGNNGFPESVITFRVAAEHPAQVHGVFVAKAQQQTAFDSDPDPVAGGTEVVGMGGNETDPDGAVGHLVIPGPDLRNPRYWG